MAARERAPWWLAGGDRRCGLCLQRYAVQVEVRCAACDCGTCPFCSVVLHGSLERVCIDCAPADLRGDGG